mmetsp:Transcript_12687/g.30959  ORF Transcript_12687/g.30959 Transcript_12687/m.30959 type:complete len:478 (-) Transcript_12687:217-1650(-)
MYTRKSTAKNMNTADSPPSEDNIKPNNDLLAWDQSRRSDEIIHELRQEQPQQHQLNYPTQQLSMTNLNQSCNRSGDSDSTPAHHSLTPFRPMQPREFSLGSNLRRLHPAMPMSILPADVSGAISAARAAKKSDIIVAHMPLKDVRLGSLESSDTPPRRSSNYSRKSSTGRSSMGRISEEAGSSSSSSGMSSGYSASLLREVGDDAAGGEIFGQNASELQPLQRADKVLQTRGELLEKPSEHVAAAALQQQSLTREMTFSQRSKGHETNNGPILVNEVVARGDSSMNDLPHTTSSLSFDAREPSAQPGSPLLRGYPLESPGHQTKSIDSDDDQSSSGDSSSSFLSWDQSRKSNDYIQAMLERSNRQQLQQANSNTLPQQQQFFAQNNSYESHPLPLQQSHPPQQPTPTVGNQSYSRKVSSHESSESISSHSPTPFRPMLPRELLLGNNLRRLNPAMPFPVLPADATSGMATHAPESIG